jgi:mannitol/fructose-specific phosphotransferase system IIA component (Ntr-type)
MDGTFDIAVMVLSVSEMVGIALPNPGNHSITTNRAVICVLVSMLPFNTIDVDEVVVLIISKRVLDS